MMVPFVQPCARGPGDAEEREALSQPAVEMTIGVELLADAIQRVGPVGT